MSAPSSSTEQPSQQQPLLSSLRETEVTEEDNTQKQQPQQLDSSTTMETGQYPPSTATTTLLPEKTEWGQTRAGQKEQQQQQQQYREIPRGDSNVQQKSSRMGGTNVDNTSMYPLYQPAPQRYYYQPGQEQQQYQYRQGPTFEQEPQQQQQQNRFLQPRPPMIESNYPPQQQQAMQQTRGQQQPQQDFSSLESSYTAPRAIYRSGSGPRIDELCKKNFSSFNIGFSFFQTSGLQKTGRWIVPRYVTVYLMLSGGGLDMTYAEFVHPQTDVYVYTLMGGYNVMVPPGVRVEAFGGAACGGVQKTQDEIEPILPQSPLVVLHSYVMMGGSTISVNRPAQMIHVITADE